VRESLGAFPGSIFKVISPPSTSSCASVSGEEASEGSCLAGDWDLERDLSRGGIGKGVDVRARPGASSTFTWIVLATPSPAASGVAPSSIFMSRSSGSSSAAFSESVSDMVGGGARAGRWYGVWEGRGAAELKSGGTLGDVGLLQFCRDNHGPVHRRAQQRASR
jgi:hypothetical protein